MPWSRVETKQERPVFRPCKVEGMNLLYTDGGVAGENPSVFGGSWAYREVDCDTGVVVQEHGEFVSCQKAGVFEISNNHMELLAILSGLEAVGKDWIGTVCSDSQISLGRVFHNWALNNVPGWMVRKLDQIRAYPHFQKLGYQLLQGHPTGNELRVGVGSRGYPVSLHNVAVDRLCTTLSRKAVEW